MKKRIGFMAFSIMIAVVVACSVSPAAAVAQSGSQSFSELAHFTSNFYETGVGTIVNPEGKGDVLIFPYYDVRRIGETPQQTLFAIINETPDSDCGFATKAGVAAKLRFREFDKSDEVFDADIWLSCNDVWVGTLERNSATGLTKLTSPDLVITAPGTAGCPSTSGSTFTVSAALSGGVDFFTTNVTDTPPPALTKADLTNMGYFEVIGTERTFSKAASGKVTRLTTDNFDALNTLSGYAFIVRVFDGVSDNYNATAIANFSVSGRCLFAGSGSEDPRLDAGDDGLGQLEFALSKKNISQGYSIENSISGKFSMIVTFPTKHFHFFDKRGDISLPEEDRVPYAILPDESLSLPFTGRTSNTGEKVNAKIYDRLENLFTPTSSPFSQETLRILCSPTKSRFWGCIRATHPRISLNPDRETRSRRRRVPLASIQVGYGSI